VLRRYLRGGLPARLSKDRYLWLGEERTRAFREFRLLGELAGLGLPVPRPVAARYVRGLFSYRGELVTERLSEVASLAGRWLAGEAGDADWQLAGRCIRRFHEAGVQHADLNANNIMLDGRGGAWLLDFDRGRRRAPGPWRERVLARLARSLEKIGRGAGRGDEWRERYAMLKAAHDEPVQG
jgi:3-deoxy-D-manno-octulosonic acid kinase